MTALPADAGDIEIVGQARKPKSIVASEFVVPAVPGSVPAASMKVKLVDAVPCCAPTCDPSLLLSVPLSVPTALLANGYVPLGVTLIL